jgi:hypothetical protein
MGKQEKMELEMVKAKELFQKTTDRIKEFKITADTRYNLLEKSKDEHSYMNAKWSWIMVKIMTEELLRLWDFLEALTLSLIEEEHKKPELETKIAELSKELKKHEPALLEFEQLMEDARRQREQNR